MVELVRLAHCTVQAMYCECRPRWRRLRLLQMCEQEWCPVGVYDGKLLALYVQPEDIDWRDVVFIDVEILRAEIHSIGNHLLALDQDDVAHLCTSYPHCANPNLWRAINVTDSFQSKYPFSTLPLLLSTHAIRDDSFRLHPVWLALMLHTDSSFTNAAQYQRNALDWLEAMRSDGRSPGLDQMCRTLKRMPGQIMISLLNDVQTWAREAGFGPLQRACRFDPRGLEHRDKICLLLNRIMTELGIHQNLPFAIQPVYVEEFRTGVLPNHTKGKRAASFLSARSGRALSMAATGRSESGLSITLPNTRSRIVALR